MDPHLTTRAAIAPRSNMSGGAIAGAVIGSIFGLSILALVLGFLYFRWKRGSRPVAELDEDDKPSDTERRLSLSGSGPPGSSHYNGQADPWASSIDGHQHTASTNDIPYTDIAYHYSDGQQFVQEPDSISNPGDGQIIEQSDFVPHSATHDGGAADYYDTSVPMDSEPEQEPSAPSRQMTELYEEQIRKSRENRKNSKGSTWSRFTQGLMSKRKRSTRVSELAMEEGNVPTSSPTTSNPDVAIDSIERPKATSASQDRSIVQDGDIFDEPQEMSDSSRPDKHTNKKTKRRGPSGDDPGLVPHRLDSLPSSALRQKPFPADKVPIRQPTRFQSPDLPEPMEDDTDLVTTDRSSAVRNSHSPVLDGQGFSAVNPMDIMRPSNAAEKAVFTNAELIRIASVSASPPASPPYNAASPPITDVEHSMTNPSHEDADHADESEYDESEEEEDEDEVMDEAPQSLEAPQITIEDVFITDGPSDWSTPGGTTLTNASSGRTPGTDITSSPSPAPSIGILHPDSSASPPESATSPKLVLTCEQCDRTFDQIHKLNHHKRYHDRRHCCPYPGCDKKFGTKTHLDRHVNDKHEKTKGYHCTESGCQYYIGGKLFPRKDNWKRHMVNKHGINPTIDPPLVG
ncbi:hypothetical protein PFICI_09863 [Pestalotiopsis fici W106-1]|uniref:C2H2-type domain-containing protein n=1 Tax=Pestalotiopsis fici (strain W106-1 / CGMCC3.15140) TaxID=1229662 RepID=W3WY39_PESFW|nr:uncharacterized protein PFICI_09863 [Pestalotiopsis fici W106-1]ETS77801.1 hypothetical protein PFICI_09863 [Pestalotiopsis fici W106-1]